MLITPNRFLCTIVFHTTDNTNAHRKGSCCLLLISPNIIIFKHRSKLYKKYHFEDSCAISSFLVKCSKHIFLKEKEAFAKYSKVWNVVCWYHQNNKNLEWKGGTCQRHNNTMPLMDLQHSVTIPQPESGISCSVKNDV